MKGRIIAITLFALLMVEDGYADRNLELARKFSPILVLTEETGGQWGDIRVTKPEPVEIVNAQSADSIRFKIYNILGQQLGGVLDWRSLNLNNWNPPIATIDFSQNRFAFLSRKYTGRPFLEGEQYAYAYAQYIIESYFDYPGKEPRVWNDTYFGSGPRAGSHPDNANTAYVHIYKTTHEVYADSITVIQYFYFYPYNHWWNNHEGDWQRIHVVVSSRDPATAEVIGVEYLFHGAHVSYYKEYPYKYNELGQTVDNTGLFYPGLTTSFVFNPRKSLKLSQGTHPIVYLGAGSHAAYPTGGNYLVYQFDPLGVPLYDTPERMTHTGLVLNTQANNSNSTLQESYDLVLLPEPNPDNTNNMGLTASQSWLGADVLWGTPFVDGRGDNRSPRGPYHKGWERLGFFQASTTGPSVPVVEDRIFHSVIPYTSYHHWPIIGNETWSDTISLSGDLVVFPGATLTINAGTVIEFEPSQDIHQFAAEGSRNDLAELFVYGTLTANGESGKPIVFQREGRTSDSATTVAWGGIRVMDGSTVALNSYTTIHDEPPLAVAYDAASYEVDFPGSQFSLETEPELSGTVTVELARKAYREWAIPITVTGDAEEGDYTVSGLDDSPESTVLGTLPFAVGERVKSFTITAHPDVDVGAPDARFWHVTRGGGRRRTRDGDRDDP